jgi:MtN3 and saliva related transmembrane protein
MVYTNTQTIIGTLAASGTTLAFIPQVVHTLRTRDTKSISLSMYITFTFGVCMWLLYGFLLDSYPIIISNIVTLILSCTVMFYKIKYK